VKLPVVTVKFTTWTEVPPPGAGFVTVTALAPPVAMSVASIAAVSCVALTNVVVLAVPPKFTTEAFTKLVPFTVRANAAPPTCALVGAIVVSVGSGFGGLTVKFTTCVDVPPPGAGFVTVTSFAPAVAISAARIEAVSCVELTNAVVLAVPPKVTTEVFTKPVPFTVKVNATPPTTPLVGLIVVTVGTGCSLRSSPPAPRFLRPALDSSP
jgi:hypothetical protein